MSLFKIICLLCDGQSTLRRLRPHKLYACQGCIETHNGIGYVTANVETFKAACIERHNPTTMAMEGPMPPRAKPPVLQILTDSGTRRDAHGS